MAPPPSTRRPLQVKRASVTSNTGAVKPKLMTPAQIIDESLPQFSIEELQDVIRIAQRHLKAKFHERRNAAPAGKQSRRFWDRPLSLDWSETGMPKIQYPRGRSHSDSELIWSPFNMLMGMARPPMEIDWEVFEMLSPPSKAAAEVDWDVLALMSPKASGEQALKFIGDDENEEEEEALEIDWSASRLPCYNIFSVRRRRRRIVDQRRCRQPPPPAAGAPAESPAAVAKRYAMRPDVAPRVPSFARRAVPRRHSIQQPGGGAAHVRGAARRM
mmetsp:Transcript_86364/g.217415  ORF Transcript_86364/g.217415 Transcript_86364/m.217415 type:complete len:272 (+) Transcript_86364:99-914(+)